MPIEYGGAVVAVILDQVPEFRAAYAEHLDDWDGELLLHLLMADLARFAVAAELAGDGALVNRVLAAAERLLMEGDEPAVNAVAVSFIEYLGAETEAGEHEVVSRFPEALSAELERQREWRPGKPTV